MAMGTYLGVEACSGRCGCLDGFSLLSELVTGEASRLLLRDPDSEYDAILKAGLSMLAALIVKEFEESSMLLLV